MSLPAETILLGAVPAGHPDRDRLAELVRIGTRFKEQQRGRRPGFLRTYLEGLVQRTRPRSFDELLTELGLEAMRRSVRGPTASPVIECSKYLDILAYDHPRHGRQEVSLKTVRNTVRMRQIPGIR